MVIPFWPIYILVTFIVAAAICTIGYFVDTAIETRKIKKKMTQTAQWLGSWGP